MTSCSKSSKISTIFLPLLVCAFLSASPPALAQSVTVSSPSPSSAAQEHETKVTSANFPVEARLRAAYGRLPLSFEENPEQTKQGVRFLSRGDGYTVLLTRSEAVLALRHGRAFKDTKSVLTNSLRSESSVLRMEFMGANPDAQVEGLDELPGKSNYFIGHDPKKWRANVPTYTKVRYRDLYPGVNLVYYGNKSGQLEYDFVVAPGADPKAIKLSVLADSSRQKLPSGETAPLQVGPGGDLFVHVGGNEILFQKPVIYQQMDEGSRQYIDGRYLLGGTASRNGNQGSEISFEVGPYDHSKSLVIDPAIAYSSLLGAATVGSGSAANALALFTDPITDHFYAYVAGETCATDFPLVNPEQRTFGGGGSASIGQAGNFGADIGCDAFVTKFDPSASGTASLVYSSYFGGSGADGATGIAVDSAGNAYITGQTSSTDLPVQGAFQQTAKYGPLCSACSLGYQEAFLAKFSADGSSLMYSTYFGGSGADASNAIALDSAGRAYIAGFTNSADLPTLNPYQATLQNRGGSPFVAAFDTTLAGTASLLYSTYLDGTQNSVSGDQAYAIALDSGGAIHLGGFTSSPSFPVVNAYQSQLGAGTLQAAFYAKLNPSAHGAAQLVYSTYLGGNNGGGVVLTGCKALPWTPLVPLISPALLLPGFLSQAEHFKRPILLETMPNRL